MTSKTNNPGSEERANNAEVEPLADSAPENLSPELGDQLEAPGETGDVAPDLPEQERGADVVEADVAETPELAEPVLEKMPAVEETTLEAVDLPQKKEKKASWLGRLFKKETPAVEMLETSSVVDVMKTPLPATAAVEWPAAAAAQPDAALLGAIAESVAPTGPSITLDDVRSLVRGEIGQAQADLSRLVQAELARAQDNRRRSTMETIRDMTESAYLSKGQALQFELHALQEEEQSILKDRSRPLRERMEDVDYLRERMVRLEGEINQLEADTVQRAVEAQHTLADLEGRGMMADLRQEVEHQKTTLAALPGQLQQAIESRLANSARGGGVKLWQLLVVLVLIVAMGAAGIILPLPLETQSEANINALVETAALYQASGQDEDALRVLDDAVAAGVSDSQLLGRMGQIYYSLGANQKAITVLTQAVQQTPTQQSFRLNLARAYARTGKHQDAADQYTELIKLNPANVIYYIELGNRYESLQKFDLAEAQYQQATRVAPDRYEGYYNLGQLYRLKLFQFDKAADQYKLALTKNPGYYLAQVYYGASLSGDQKYDQAIEQFNIAIESNPDGQSAPLFMGDTYMAMADYTEAISWYERVLELNPSSTLALMGLGNAYLALDDCTKASQQFAAVLKIQPTNKDAHSGLDKCAGK